MKLNPEVISSAYVVFEPARNVDESSELGRGHRLLRDDLPAFKAARLHPVEAIPS